MNVNRCIRDYEHAFDPESGWCWRCGKVRGDGQRVGRRWERWPVVDITTPRRGDDS